MKKIGFLHILPFFLAITLSYFFLKLNYIPCTKPSNTAVISGLENIQRYISTVDSKPKNQLALIESLCNKNSISVFGSSELTTDTPYITYNFLPDSLKIPCKAFGHAYFQSFALYCQLLGMKEYIRNSKICIILSPGWFESDGTNIEAFLEHVRPEFLKRIIWDSSISISQKKMIGNYLNKHVDQIDYPSSEIEYFQLLASKKSFIQQFKLNHIRKNFIYNCKYHLEPTLKNKQVRNPKYVNWKRASVRTKLAFSENSKSNPFFISDFYFKQHIKTIKNYEKKEYKPLSLESNTELNDLLKLIRFLKEEKVKPVFIVQGLNPYAYSNLQRFNPILKVIKAECKKQGFPILDLFSDNKKNYEPGILNDVMHMGDYGWLKVNQFIKQSFYE